MIAQNNSLMISNHNGFVFTSLDSTNNHENLHKQHQHSNNMNNSFLS